MRHAKSSQRLSLVSEQKLALVQSLVRNLVIHGRIVTTFARAKEAQRLADRLVTLGKEGSIHARRRAFRVLQDRTLVKQLFGEIAPRFVDTPGGYTRVIRLGLRRGDGAQEAQLSFSRLPALEVPAPAKAKSAAQAKPADAEEAKKEGEQQDESKKSKGMFEGLRGLWTKKKKGGG